MIISVYRFVVNGKKKTKSLTIKLGIEQIFVGILVNGPRPLFSPRAIKLVILLSHDVALDI